MLPKDESQHNAELRQAFLKHLPRRAEAVRKRGLRVCKGDWDVNTVTLLYQDVQGLAGAAGRYGLVDASEKLFQIERALEPLIKHLRLPDDGDRQRIEGLLDALIEVANPPAPQIRTVRDFIVAPADKLAGANVPMFLRAPEDYWRRFSQHDVAPISSETHGKAPAQMTIAAPKEWALGDPVPPGLRLDAPAQIVNSTSVFGLDQPAPSPPVPKAPVAIEKEAPRLATGRVFYLADIAPFARELTQQLLGMKFQVERVDSPEELKEMLGSLSPEAIVTDGTFFEQIEHLGEFIKRVRARTQLKIPLLAFSSANDLASRLKAMRAGADAFVTLPMPVKDAAARIRDLMELPSAEPFKVMIVEDDRSQAIFAESVLRKAGFDTLAITDPLETLDRLERFKPDLILMDLYMPNISGMELTSIIRERDQFINTPIVFLSGEQDSEKHFEALSAGGDDFLAKPIRPKHLISAVNNRARRARQIARKRVLDPRDSTTGLYHRTYVIDCLNDLLAVDDRSQQRGGVLFIEIDGAQNLREQRGLAVYEPVMKQLGATIASFAQEDELAARYGDSSFILLSGVREVAALKGLGAAMIARLAQDLIEAEKHSVRVAARVGIAPFSVHMADASDMLNAAERASARARQQPGHIALHEAQAVGEGTSLADAVRRALEDDQLQLLFQPIVSLHSTGEEQYEVLLRMRGESGEIIGAAQVLEAARSAGLVAAVDRWCLAQCLRIIEDRKRQGRPVRLFINQCVESTMDAERIPWLKQQLETRRISPDAVTLEVKLSDVLSSMREALAFFEAVRKLGVRVVVDEYDGSLTALQLLSVLSADFLKLADKYTKGNGNHAPDELRTLIRAAHDGGKYVIAAKVENAQSAASLWTLGVDLIQGNFVQQPGTDLGFDFSASAL